MQGGFGTGKGSQSYRDGAANSHHEQAGVLLRTSDDITPKET
jgi:hypothetical protein